MLCYIIHKYIYGLKHCVRNHICTDHMITERSYVTQTVQAAPGGQKKRKITAFCPE